jgi:hypothetical protein
MKLLSRKIEFRAASVKRTTTLLIDKRALLTKSDLRLVKENYIDRLFVKGLNSRDQQMMRALSYAPVRDLYRFRSGSLMASVDSEFTSGKVMVSVTYDPVILATLEDRYGFMFAFSQSNIDYIDKIVESRLIAQGLDVENDYTLIQERNDLLAIDAQKVIDDMNEAKLDNEIPSIDTEIEDPNFTPRGKAGQEVFEYFYINDTKLTQDQLRLIENHLRNRILTNQQTSNDTLIKESDMPFIDFRTINSIKITQPQKGVLRLRVTFYTTEVLNLHRKIKIFDFSPSDINYIQNLLNRNGNV